MLIFNGVRNAYRRMRPRKIEAEDEYEFEPVHVRASGDTDGAALPGAETVSVSEWHHGHHGHPGHHHHKHPQPNDTFMNYCRAMAFVVGMVHRIGAETPTQVLIFVAAVGAARRGAEGDQRLSSLARGALRVEPCAWSAF